MHERLLQLRKDGLGISQEEFGSKIGVTRAAISRYETGERSLSETIILAICREFHVNYFWLTEGKGEIFTQAPQNTVDEIAEDYELDEIDKKIIEEYLKMPPDHRKIIKEYLKNIFT